MSPTDSPKTDKAERAAAAALAREAERKARMAAALRDNLKKRKAAARASATGTSPDDPT